MPDAAGALSIATGHPSLPGGKWVAVLWRRAFLETVKCEFFGALAAWLSSPRPQEQGSGSHRIQTLRLPAPLGEALGSLYPTVLSRRDGQLSGLIWRNVCTHPGTGSCPADLNRQIRASVLLSVASMRNRGRIRLCKPKLLS